MTDLAWRYPAKRTPADQPGQVGAFQGQDAVPAPEPTALRVDRQQIPQLEAKTPFWCLGLKQQRLHTGSLQPDAENAIYYRIHPEVKQAPWGTNLRH